MDFFHLADARCSVRSFLPRAVDAKQRHAILTAANRAPSAGNLQAYAIIEVAGRGSRSELARAAGGQDFLTDAPLVLVFCALPRRSAAKYGARGKSLYCIQDATLACAYAQLAAAALGLGSVWVGAFDEAEVQRVLGLAPDVRPVALLPVGHAAEQPERTPRRPLEDLVMRVE